MNGDVAVVKLAVVPMTIEEANRLVGSWHRHHVPVVGARFCIGVLDGAGAPHGAAIIGRPVARMAGDPRRTAEVTRLVTDGTPNACSMLYAAAARSCKAMGFERIQTYILVEEPGTSLRASGWQQEATSGGGSWVRVSRPERNSDQPQGAKTRWALALNEPRPAAVFAEVDDGQEVLGLVG